VRVPGKKGSFQVLKTMHQLSLPWIVDQSEWLIRITMNNIYISGGVIEVKANKIILLADSVN